MPCWCRCLVDCRNILHQLIEPNPELRIPLPELICHAWLTKNGKYPFTTHVPLPRDKHLRNQVSVLVLCPCPAQFSMHDHECLSRIVLHLFAIPFISSDRTDFFLIFLSLLYSFTDSSVWVLRCFLVGWWIGVILISSFTFLYRLVGCHGFFVLWYSCIIYFSCRYNKLFMLSPSLVFCTDKLVLSVTLFIVTYCYICG